MVATNATILVSKPGLPAKDLKELIAWVKANQDKVSIGTGGAGTPAHVSAVYFQNVTGTKPQIIHYRGAAPATQDLLAGQIDFMFDPGIAFQHVKSGRLKMLAVGSPKRSPLFPDVPTLDEAGLKGFAAFAVEEGPGDRQVAGGIADAEDAEVDDGAEPTPFDQQVKR